MIIILYFSYDWEHLSYKVYCSDEKLHTARCLYVHVE